VSKHAQEGGVSVEGDWLYESGSGRNAREHHHSAYTDVNQARQYAGKNWNRYLAVAVGNAQACIRNTSFKLRAVGADLSGCGNSVGAAMAVREFPLNKSGGGIICGAKIMDNTVLALAAAVRLQRCAGKETVRLEKLNAGSPERMSGLKSFCAFA
jgi:hypothetical protein